MNAALARSPLQVLVVDDESRARELVRWHLSRAGFQVVECNEGLSALELARTLKFELIVLDVTLPGVDGVTICRAVRAGGANRETPLLMLTAQRTESDKVLGLESGADDYVTKPFGARELVARAHALTRRHLREGPFSASAGNSTLQIHGLSLDAERRQIAVRGQVVNLTRQEFDVLHLLASRAGIVFTRPALLHKVWPKEREATERTVDAVVSRLRRKIEERPRRPELILTAWGSGYKFADAN
jgi:DNA-binding response OmpR family regulator